MQRGIFLDRDGTLNHLIYYGDTDEYESPRSAATLNMIDGVEAALQALARAGWLLFIVSNQPSYAKGKTTLEELQGVHEAMHRHLLGAGVQLTEAYYCYHHPRGIVPAYTCICECRKPGIASLRQAQAAFDLDLSACWMIGDQDSDMQCGQAAGCGTVLLHYQHSAPKRTQQGYQPNHHSQQLTDAVEWILLHTDR